MKTLCIAFGLLFALCAQSQTSDLFDSKFFVTETSKLARQREVLDSLIFKMKDHVVHEQKHIQVFNETIDWFNKNIGIIPQPVRADSLSRLINYGDERTRKYNTFVDVLDMQIKAFNTLFDSVDIQLDVYSDAEIAKGSDSIHKDWNLYIIWHNEYVDWGNDLIGLFNQYSKTMNELFNVRNQMIDEYNASVRAK